VHIIDGPISTLGQNDIHYAEKDLIGVEGIGVGPIGIHRAEMMMSGMASGRTDIKKLITKLMPKMDIIEAYEMI